MDEDSQLALSVRCGSCKNVINIPAKLLPRLMEMSRFNCPHCKAAQQIPSQYLMDAANRLGGGSSTQLPLRRTLKSSRSRAGYDEQWDDEEERDDGPESEEFGEEEPLEPTDIFADYRPSKLKIGKPHPDPVVETASLAAVEPPDISYKLHLQDVIDEGRLSGLQLEAIVYACQRHQQKLPWGGRCGFFIGDAGLVGAGVGKGRTIAGLILENWRCGRKRHLWVSIGSDLRVDARRDLDDVGAPDVAIHALNKLQYGQLDSVKMGVKEGVVFLSYSSLISGCENGQTRLDQLTEWCGPNFDGLIVYDECHKAKNLVPESGAKPTKVGRLVLELQQKLPSARVVYCSATGACEPRNMGYMERLGLWGPQSPFSTFVDFLDVVGSRGVGALEMIAMDMKAQGMYVCRTLSFAGAEFDIVESELEEPLKSQYAAAAKMWSQLRREFLYALEQVSDNSEEPTKKRGGNMLWRFFWASHQRFFRHMCMAAKVPALVRAAEKAIEEGKCVVIGLQSTGEARTQDVIAEKGEELDDFVSGPRELLLKLVEDHYPLPPDPDKPQANGKPAGAPKRQRGGKSNGVQKQGRKRARKKKDSEYNEAEEETPNECASGDEDFWERKHGSGPASTSQTQAALLAQSTDGRKRLEEIRVSLGTAAGRKAQVKACMAGLALPHNPLDMLIDLLGGPDKVAEMTGRKGRLVRIKRDASEEDNGEKMGVRWEARNASGVGSGATLDMINVHERQLFLDGVKLVAIISEAASAGISLHADKRAKNQKRRVHLTLELPWSADKAIQQFGRSHRANQAHGPQYRLLFTPLGGERRFASSVARRLESLGALTQGDRKAGLSLHSFNYESQWGQKALKTFYRIIVGDEYSPIKIPACTNNVRSGHARLASEDKFLGLARAQLIAVGIIRPNEDAVHVNAYMSQENGAPPGVGKIADTDKQDVGRFLNRLLGLEPAWQCYLFDFFQALMEHVIAAAKREGKYQDGITDLRATHITMSEPPKVIWTDQRTRATSYLCAIVTDRGISWQQVCDILRPPIDLDADSDVEADESANGARPKPKPGRFYRSIHKFPGMAKHAVVLGTPQDASANPPILVVRPNTGRQPRPMAHDQFFAKYAPVDELVARQLWDEAYSESNLFHGQGNRLKKLHVICGMVLPIWPQIENCLNKQIRQIDRRLNVTRLETTGPEKKRLVGVLLPPQCVEPLLEQLRAARNATPHTPIDLDD